MTNDRIFAERVDAIIELRRKFYPDLFFQFVPSEAPLRIIFRAMSVRRVRLELVQPGALHLGSIDFEDDRPEGFEIQAAADLSLSSVYPGTEKLLEERQFFNFGFDGLGFHTNVEERPWADVSFPAPRVLRGMSIYNRSGKFAPRAWTLRVRVETDDGVWLTVFDHLERQSELESVLAGSIAFQPPELRSTFEVLDRVVLSALGGKFGSMKKDLRADVGADQVAKAEIRRIVNDKILFPRQVEWTTHGVTRSFRFWSDKEKEKYLLQANKLVGVISEVFPDVCLGFGSVLSIVRDRQLMPHDDDLDVIVALPQSSARKISEGLQLVSEHLKDRGYKVRGKYKSHWHVSRKGSKPIDVFVGIYENGDRISWYPGPRGSLVRDDVFPPIRASLFGAPCLIPRNPFRYLEEIYGAGWGIPTPRWHHRWNRSAFSDLF
jgi:hypothetical protein